MWGLGSGCFPPNSDVPTPEGPSPDGPELALNFSATSGPSGDGPSGLLR